MNWYISVLKQYTNFSGRARRKEFWMFILFHFLVILALAIVTGAIAALVPALSFLGFFVFLYLAVTFLPYLGVAVRRLHDTGKSGWFILVNLIPAVGGIIFLVFVLLDSQPGENQYGPNPKA